MEIVFAITTVLAILVALFYRSKAKEFESLFELSKSYDTITVADARGMIPGMTVRIERPEYSDTKVKLNKDGSIAKKRGRKPSNAKTV